MNKSEEYHKRKFKEILQEKSIYGDVVIDDSDVSCDVRRGNCKLLLDKYELDCANSKVSQKNINIEEPIGLPERLKNAKKNAALCKDGRLEYIKSCCRSKTNERALATDMGHLVQIVKMQKIQDFIDRELALKASERKVREAERKAKDVEEKRREAEEARKEENRRQKAKEEARKADEARKAEKKQPQIRKMPTEIENKISRFLISQKHKLTDIARVIEMCGSVYERVLLKITDLSFLREIDLALTVIKIQLTQLIGSDDTDTVLTFLVNFLVKKIRGKGRV